MMRKLVVIGLIAVLSLTLLAFLAGCGGDANKDEAKSNMITGDDYMDSAILDWTTLDEMQAEMATGLMEGTALSPEELEALGQEYEERFTGLATSLSMAAEEYNKILALDGVQDYKDYATKMLAAIDLYEQALDAAIAVSEQATAMLEAGASMEDLMGMMQSEELAMVSDLRDEADKLLKEANQIKLDKKLED